MAEETGIQEGEAGADATQNQDATITLTQTELDALMSERARRARESERKKYADYDKYKSAYEAQAAADEANKSDLQKALERVAELEAEKTAREAADAHKALVEQVMKESKIDAKLAPLLTATDEEGLKAQAELISESIPFSEPSRNERKRPAAVDKPESTADHFAELLQQNGIYL